MHTRQFSPASAYVLRKKKQQVFRGTKQRWASFALGSHTFDWFIKEDSYILAERMARDIINDVPEAIRVLFYVYQS